MCKNPNNFVNQCLMSGDIKKKFYTKIVHLLVYNTCYFDTCWQFYTLEIANIAEKLPWLILNFGAIDFWEERAYKRSKPFDDAEFIKIKIEPLKKFCLGFAPSENFFHLAIL